MIFVLGSITATRQTLRRYDRITNMGRILRRYFIMNAFDGAIIIFGVLFGAFTVGINDSLHVISLGISTLIAVSLSGFSGAFLTESAERKKEIHDIEQKMLDNIQNSEIVVAYKHAIYFAAIVNALSPLFAGLCILLPFFVINYIQISIFSAYLASFILSFTIFFALGSYLGKMTHENLLISGLKMLAVGVICAVLNWAILPK